MTFHNAELMDFANLVRNPEKFRPLFLSAASAVPKRDGIHDEVIMGPLLSRVVFILSYLSHPSRSFTVLFLSGALHFAMKSFSESSMLFLSSGSAK